MLKYVKTNQTFLEQQDAGNIEDTDIVFIEDISNIWTHGHRFCSVEGLYPVGSIYMSVNNVNPSNLFGFGTWEQIKDMFLLAAGDVYGGGTLVVKQSIY